MMVSAFAGQSRVLEAYDSAVEHKMRFFSYGDAMLLRRRTDVALEYRLESEPETPRRLAESRLTASLRHPSSCLWAHKLWSKH